MHHPGQGTADPLHELARLWGVQTSYVDVEGVERPAGREALLAVLEALGAPVSGEGDVEAALRARHLQRWRERLPPVTVVWEGHPGRVLLRSPRDRVPGAVACRLVLEDGTDQSWAQTLDAPEHQAEVEGTSFVAHRLPLPGDLPPGYHRLRVEAGYDHLHTHLIVAPRQAWGADRPERVWGGFLPLYALRRETGQSVGHLGDLQDLGLWLAERGGRVLGTLPLLAAFLDEPFEPSPYAPVSRLFWNELHLDLAALPEARTGRLVREIVQSPAFRTETERLRGESLLDYRAAARQRRRVLQACSDLFFQGPPGRRAELDRYLAERPEAETYARFRATTESRGEPWHEWPARLRDGRLEEGDFDEAARRYHLYAQMAFQAQMGEVRRNVEHAGAQLYLDLPLGVHPAGFDVWQDRDSFAPGMTAGAPPDPFFRGGQGWGFPPMHPEGGRRTGHRYWAASLANHLRMAGRLRIDHVMGLHRLFWVPDGLTPSEGVYVRYPAEELWAVLTLESHRHQARIVGENLGTVPEEVDRAMAEHAVKGMWVGGFSIRDDPEDALPMPPPGVLAALNTHDMPTFAGWWLEQDVAQRVELGFLAPEDAEAVRAERARQREALCRFFEGQGLAEAPCDLDQAARAALERLAESEADLVLINLEDLWMEPEPQNVPGTHREVPNWRRRTRPTFESFRSDPRIGAALDAVARRRRE